MFDAVGQQARAADPHRGDGVGRRQGEGGRADVGQPVGIDVGRQVVPDRRADREDGQQHGADR